MTTLQIVAAVILFLLLAFFLVAFFVRPKWTSEQWAITRLFASLVGGIAGSLLIMGSFEIKISLKALGASGTGGAGVFLLIWWTWIKTIPLDEIIAVVEDCKRVAWDLVSSRDFNPIKSNAESHVLAAIETALQDAQSGRLEARQALLATKGTKSLLPLYEYLKRKELSVDPDKPGRIPLVVLAYLLHKFDYAKRLVEQELAKGNSDPLLAQILASIEEKHGNPGKAHSIIDASIQEMPLQDKRAKEERAKMLMFLAHLERKSKDPKTRISRLQEAYSILIETDNLERLVECLLSLAEALDADGKSAEADACRQNAERLSTDLNPTGKRPTSFLRQKGQQLLKKQDFDLAKQCFIQALRADEGSLECQILDHDGLADVYLRLGQFDQATAELNLAMQKCFSIGCAPGRLSKNVRLAEICEKQGDFTTALKYIRNAIEIGESLQLSEKERSALQTLHDFYFANKFGPLIKKYFGR